MKLDRQIKSVVELTTNKLDEMGITWYIERTRRHFKLLYYVNQKGFTQIISATSSDGRTALNIRGDVMRTIRKEMENAK
jgi:hypothetical protein